MSLRYFVVIITTINMVACVAATTLVEQNIDVSGFEFNVQGGNNIPQFTFSYSEDSKNESDKTSFGPYYFRLKYLYEADSTGKKIGPSVQQFSGGKWNMTDSVTNADTYKFNMSVGPFYKGPTTQWEDFTLRMTVWKPHAVGSPCTGQVCLKFDVVISSYVFVGGVENSSLVIACWVSGPNQAGAATSSLKSGRIDLSKGFVTLAPTAQAGNATVKVSSTLEQGELLLSFSPFASNSTLVYDPLLGINYTPLPVGLIIGLSVAGGVVLILIVVGVIVYLRRRRSAYQSM